MLGIPGLNGITFEELVSDTACCFFSSCLISVSFFLSAAFFLCGRPFVLVVVNLVEVERGATNGRRKDIVTEENEKEEKKRRRNERRIERKPRGCRFPLHFPLDVL